MLADVQRQFGESKVVTRTGSGGFHCYYLHNGEARKIRPDPRKPIDLIGDGPIVLPPSRGFLGNYEIIHGHIDDLALEPIRSAPRVGSAAMAIDLSDARRGNRDKKFWPHVARQAHFAKSLDELIDIAREMNEMMAEPWSDNEANSEIIKRCKYWWDKTQKGENWFGVGKYVQSTHEEIDSMFASPVNQDAYLLLAYLRRYHWGRSFSFANAMHQSLRWTLRRFVAARARLIELRYVTVIKQATRHDPALCKLKTVAI